MYNNYTNIESVEPENKILDVNSGNHYNSGINGSTGSTKYN